jgi:hypothetical protein
VLPVGGEEREVEARLVAATVSDMAPVRRAGHLSSDKALHPSIDIFSFRQFHTNKSVSPAWRRRRPMNVGQRLIDLLTSVGL